MRNISFHADAWQDYLYWYQTSKSTFRKINELIRDTQRNPFAGLGKPEALKHDLQGCWSRRITREHRLIYRIESDTLFILSCRYHY
ncbi:MAG: Txe/YoeB family addiction module toxin [Gemmatimonadetes bacterium]|nr:Txe/YoeB family addiction module toxin [Gemmatimonadota bacterium]MDE2740652.1 Txe/YoeB family addiction module toxin [Gemmatimonadota bacterium]